MYNVNVNDNDHKMGCTMLMKMILMVTKWVH